MTYKLRWPETDHAIYITINDVIDADTAQIIAEEMGHKVKRVSEADVVEGLAGDSDTAVIPVTAFQRKRIRPAFKAAARLPRAGSTRLATVADASWRRRGLDASDVRPVAKSDMAARNRPNSGRCCSLNARSASTEVSG